MPYCHLSAAAASALTERTFRMEPNHTETEPAAELVTETLVEEVSIDGMCGVY